LLCISLSVISASFLIELRREIVRTIRSLRPDIVVTCDPQTLFAAYGINHPDHRAAGQAVLDAVFPAAGNASYFPELMAEGLQPHMPNEIWCALTNQPSVTLDITDTWPTKLEALLKHRSQVGVLKLKLGCCHGAPKIARTVHFEERRSVWSSTAGQP
jgi:LmbE family N-acetylglucosaminyl deacetylase